MAVSVTVSMAATVPLLGKDLLALLGNLVLNVVDPVLSHRLGVGCHRDTLHHSHALFLAAYR